MGSNTDNFEQVHVIAGVVLRRDGRYLLVQENHPDSKVYGLWNFPAGHVEKGNTIEETAVKEAKEESGYDVELVRRVAIFHENAEVSVKHAFEAKITGGELKWPEDEILDARWFSLEELEGMKDKLRGEWILGAIKALESNN